jgi:exosortase
VPANDPALPGQASAVRWPAILFLGCLWLVVFQRIHDAWSTSVVYAYGWAVPLLALYLARERWLTRPTATRARPRPAMLWRATLLLMIGYVPVRIVQEANPDWVKVNWVMMGIACGVTLAAAWALGGGRQAAHFAFPVLFCFTALPWPVWMEEALVQLLMRTNASVCAELLTLGGLPALAQGNLIQISTNWLNVEEACSGIQSLQTTFMMSLFLGEFHRLVLARRAALLLAALALAFVGNMGRTLVLAHFARSGTADSWHDAVGNGAMLLTLAGVWCLGLWLRRRGHHEGHPADELPPSAFPALLPAPLAFTGLTLLAGAEGVTEAWYRVHEHALAPARTWSVAWPRDAKGFAERPLSERSRALLKFTQGAAASWSDRQGRSWEAYFLTWEPSRVSKYLAMSHYPSVCLPATGLTFLGDTGPWDWRGAGIHLPFNGYLFKDGGREVHVFHAIAEDRPVREGSRFAYYQVTTTERLESVLRGERNLGQRVLGIAVRGCRNPREAREATEALLRSLVVAREPQS